LYAAERDGWYHPVTGDESWFFFNTLPRRMWTLSRGDVVTKPRQQIQSKEFMFRNIWNPIGFDDVGRLLNHTKMNRAYFLTNILIPLDEAIFPQGRAPHENRLVIHLDNCSVHTSRVSTNWLEEHSILRMPHPPYSPDLASSDFYLFLTVNEKFEWIHLADEDQCLSACKRF
jgi:histone-lysine N-methyltransferase SETMAR